MEPANSIFNFHIPASKSIYNRALIVQSYAESMKIIGSSQAEDVVYLQEALADLQSKASFEAGLGGTTFRFLALRLSRQKGKFRINADPHLLQRPQNELQAILFQLGVQISFSSNYIDIESKGWKQIASPLIISQKDSTQFSSAVLLNSWDLEFDLCLEIQNEGLSQGYWQMTLELVKQMGMSVLQTGSGYLIPAGQKVQMKQYSVESDMSSAFAMACLASLKKSTLLTHIPEQSLQPDFVFIEILKKMGVFIQRPSVGTIEVFCAREIKPIQISLHNCPDMFPVLAVLCAKAQGYSKLSGAPQLAHKESNRILKIGELLTKMGVKNQILDDGIEIYGQVQNELKTFVFDAEADHRLVMAATIAKAMGHHIQILHPESIRKSFPEFLQWAGAYL